MSLNPCTRLICSRPGEVTVTIEGARVLLCKKCARELVRWVAKRPKRKK